MNILYQKNVKNYTKCIQKSHKTLVLYIYCIQRLYKSKFHDTECTKNVHQIPTHIQKMHKLYKTFQNFKLKRAWNLKCMSYLLDTCQISTEKIKTTQTLQKKVSEFAKSESLFEPHLKAVH